MKLLRSKSLFLVRLYGEGGFCRGGLEGGCNKTNRLAYKSPHQSGPCALPTRIEADLSTTRVFFVNQLRLNGAFCLFPLGFQSMSIPLQSLFDIAVHFTLKVRIQLVRSDQEQGLRKFCQGCIIIDLIAISLNYNSIKLFLAINSQKQMYFSIMDPIKVGHYREQWKTYMHTSIPSPK